MTNQALEMHVPHAGPPEVFVELERDLAPPAAGELRVAIEAAGVTHSDILSRLGRYSGQRLPVTPGNDFVGRVESIGEDVAGYVVGQRVAGTSLGGCYATRRNISASSVVTAPESTDAVSLVAATLNGVCAWQMFHRLANVESGEWVLVHGATGGVGSMLLDIARLAGANVIGTASAKKALAVTSRGGVHVDYDSEDVAARARSISDGGVVAAFDHVGGKHLIEVSMSALRPGGMAVLYGLYNLTRNENPPPDAIADLMLNDKLSGTQMFTQSKSYAGYILTPWSTQRPAAYKRDMQQVLGLVSEGKLSPLIAATFPLQEVAKAHRAMESRSMTGKIVLVA
jgi:NADPH:quinone reductase-like Zn-dependent oxidoreductase